MRILSGGRWDRSMRSRIAIVRGISFVFLSVWEGIEMNIGGRYSEDSTRGGERSPSSDWRSCRPDSPSFGDIFFSLSWELSACFVLETLEDFCDL